MTLQKLIKFNGMRSRLTPLAINLMQRPNQAQESQLFTNYDAEFVFDTSPRYDEHDRTSFHYIILLI